MRDQREPPSPDGLAFRAGDPQRASGLPASNTQPRRGHDEMGNWIGSAIDDIAQGFWAGIDWLLYG